MILFDFSLLTKMSPVSLAAAGASARTAATRPQTRLRTPLPIATACLSACRLCRLLPSVRPIKAVGQVEGAGARQCGSRLAKIKMDEYSDRDPPALLLDKVVKSYGPIKAVNGVSLVAH